MGGNALRFTNEPSRHKTLDLLGDLSLVGAPIQGKIIAYKTGHWLNQHMARPRAFGRLMVERLECSAFAIERERAHCASWLSIGIVDFADGVEVIPAGMDCHERRVFDSLGHADASQFARRKV